jgi:hypothetical protein
MFDQAKLAAVAYVQVTGADGSSTLCNSGITTTKVTTGAYALTLPSGSSNTQTLQQSAAADLVLASANGQTPCAVAVDNSNATTKYLYFVTGSGSPVDTDFSAVILRTLP